jgi:hypothetical protein
MIRRWSSGSKFSKLRANSRSVLGETRRENCITHWRCPSDSSTHQVTRIADSVLTEGRKAQNTLIQYLAIKARIMRSFVSL